MMHAPPTMTRDGWTICRYDAVDSTQTAAAGLIADGTPHRTVIVAERQTAGYGRKGDVWRDLPGACLLMTIVVRPCGPIAVPRYAMIAALASVEAIGAAAGLAAALKWPNDVLLNGRKVAGILGDATWKGARLEALRLGVGINVTGDRAAFLARDLPGATSCAAEAGHMIDRESVLAAWLATFARTEDRFVAGHDAEIFAAWRAALATIGRRVVAVRADGRAVTGVATGVTDDGDLTVSTESGEHEQLCATDIRSLRYAD
jgi:BirA family biotin operon repressor/biotin-[acetyl-CoA-carboxylase] ligase